MPQLILKVVGEFNVVGVLGDDGITFTPPPPGCFYEVINNYKFAPGDPDLQFLKVTSSFGYLVYRIVNPYGADLTLAADGRICDRPLVSFTLNADRTLITDVKIDESGYKVARKLQLIFDSNPTAPEFKFFGGELSSDVDKVTEYIQYWFNTQAMRYYTAEFNRIMMQPKVALPRTFNGFVKFVGQEARRTEHIKHSAVHHAEIKPRQEKDHITGRAAEFWRKLRVSQEAEDAAKAEASVKRTSAAPAAAGSVMFSRAAQSEPPTTSDLDARFEVELGKTTILSLADKYKIIGSLPAVKAILDEIVEIYQAMPALRKISLSNTLRQLFDTCPILELMLCMQALVHLKEDPKADTQSIKGQLKAVIVEITLNYKVELFRDEVLQLFFDNDIDDILFKYCPVRLQTAHSDLSAAIAASLAKEQETVEDTESVMSEKSEHDIAAPSTSAKSGSLRTAVSKPRPTPQDADDACEVDDISEASEQVAPSAFEQAVQLLKFKPFSKSTSAALMQLLDSNPTIAKETHPGEATLLMRALANREVPFTVLEALINQAEDAIAHLDRERQGAVHWWVRYRNPNNEESFKLFELLFGKSIEYLQRVKFAKFLASHGQLNLVPLMEYFRDATSNTFLHLLIPKVKSPHMLGRYLKAIVPPPEVDVSLQAASALIIAKNNRGDNALCIFKEVEYSINPNDQAGARRKSEYESAEVELKVFYNRMAVRLSDPDVVIDPAAYGPDFLNVFNFQPKDPKDRLYREFKRADKIGITHVYRIIKDQMEVRGVMRPGNIHGDRFVDLLGNNEICSMFLSDTFILSSLCIDMYINERQVSKPRIKSVLTGWLASEEIKTTPVECLTRYLIAYAVEQPCPDQDEIAACLAVISLLVAQLRTLRRDKWAPFNEKRDWDFASFSLYSTLSFLGDMPDLRIDLGPSLADLQYFVECYTLATDTRKCNNDLRKAFKLLNAKEAVSAFDRRLITTLRAGLTSRVPNEKALHKFLQGCPCHHEGPVDWIQNPEIRHEVRINFDPIAQMGNECMRNVM